MKITSFIVLLFAIVSAGNTSAQDVTYQRLLNADKEPQNWLTFSAAIVAGDTAHSVRSRRRTRITWN